MFNLTTGQKVTKRLAGYQGDGPTMYDADKLAREAKYAVQAELKRTGHRGRYVGWYLVLGTAGTDPTLCCVGVTSDGVQFRMNYAI